MRTRGSLVMSLFVMAGLALASPATAGTPQVGDVAPDATLTLVNGGKVQLSDLRGQVVIINFWATWCGPCLRELPTLDAYYRIQHKYGLRVFAVATEDSVPAFRLHKLFDKLAIDPVRRIRGPYRDLDAVPTNYVIGRDGVIRYAKAAAFDLDALNEILVPLLKERYAAPTPAAPAATR